MQLYILCGASSEIAKAYFTTLNEHLSSCLIVTISRQPQFAADNPPIKHSNKHLHFETDYSEASLSAIAKTLTERPIPLSELVIFNGILHDLNNQPERKLEQISDTHFINSMQTNALLPIRCVTAFSRLLDTKTKSVICALSARVGSINDNNLGGWYSYRASKAALNMLFKSAAIELSRRYKQNRCVLFHPGTTDTPLSKPFQGNVPDGKLFTPSFVSEQLFKFLSDARFLANFDNPAYFDWQGQPIDW
ncbi:SDR family NAD(P)-dependent oxidoreductase [Pseudoalteromonas arabiensis]|uniref:SDR family NAD(P)-dependent oxidoreductase n=1 Tax=Pseudoalteromonas arabiensis TaxID=874454 RepID=UPI000782385E|nr:SDR family NAD(P)-dependent oxidoreductase [Pseudoalteromonas arabiensis]